MTEGLKSIIAQLEHQKAAIERALIALREVEGGEAQAPEPPLSAAATRQITRSGRNRRSEGQKKRWAAKKAAEASPAEAPQKAAHRRKTRLSPEGRQRLAEAMKHRWALKRAASAVTKTKRKRAMKKAA